MIRLARSAPLSFHNLVVVLDQVPGAYTHKLATYRKLLATLGQPAPKTKEQHFVHNCLYATASTNAAYLKSSEGAQQLQLFHEKRFGTALYCRHCKTKRLPMANRAGYGSAPTGSFCSASCSRRAVLEDPERRLHAENKARVTSLHRWGTANPAQSLIVQQRKESTCLLRYGVANPASAPAIYAKVQATCLARHGTLSPQSAAHIKQKSLQTMQQRYGVSHALQSSTFRRKFRTTCRRNHGAAYPMQASVPFLRNKSASYCRKDFVTVDGRKLMLQGFEPQVAAWLENKGFTVYSCAQESISVPMQTKVYHPDLLVRTPAGNTHVVEVKSSFTVTLPDVLPKFLAAQRFSEACGLSDYVLCVWTEAGPSVFKGRPGYRTLKKQRKELETA